MAAEKAMDRQFELFARLLPFGGFCRESRRLPSIRRGPALDLAKQWRSANSASQGRVLPLLVRRYRKPSVMQSCALAFIS
jgi:hypothetical protein